LSRTAPDQLPRPKSGWFEGGIEEQHAGRGPEAEGIAGGGGLRLRELHGILSKLVGLSEKALRNQGRWVSLDPWAGRKLWHWPSWL